MLKNRTIIEFGIPGDEPSIVHYVKDKSLIIREILDNSDDIKVGDFAEMDSTTYTGIEFELSFKSPEAAMAVAERLIAIARKFIVEEEIRRRKDFARKFGSLLPEDPTS